MNRLLMLLLIIGAHSLGAQTDVRILVSEKDGDNIEGTLIYINNNYVGTTDEYGAFYYLSQKGSEYLRIEHLGYETYSDSIVFSDLAVDGLAQIEISLEPQYFRFDDIEIVGEKKKVFRRLIDMTAVDSLLYLVLQENRKYILQVENLNSGFIYKFPLETKINSIDKSCLGDVIMQSNERTFLVRETDQGIDIEQLSERECALFDKCLLYYEDHYYIKILTQVGQKLQIIKADEKNNQILYENFNLDKYKELRRKVGQLAAIYQSYYPDMKVDIDFDKNLHLNDLIDLIPMDASFEHLGDNRRARFMQSGRNSPIQMASDINREARITRKIHLIPLLDLQYLLLDEDRSEVSYIFSKGNYRDVQAPWKRIVKVFYDQVRREYFVQGQDNTIYKVLPTGKFKELTSGLYQRDGLLIHNGVLYISNTKKSAKTASDLFIRVALK